MSKIDEMMTDEKTLSPSSSSGSRSPEELKELGNKAFAAKEYAEAIKFYSDAIRIDPLNHVYFSNRSASHAGQLEWEAAADDAKECIRLDPSFVKGYYRLATAQIEMRNFDGAAATIRRGLDLEPNNPQLLKLMRSSKKQQQAIVQQQQQQQQHQRGMTDLAPSGTASDPASFAWLDDATRKELQDLQAQHSQTSRELSMVQGNLVKTQRDCKIHELTKAELDEIDAADGEQQEKRRYYRTIGKMFLCSSKDQVGTFLDKQIEEHKKKQSDLQQKMEYLERRIKSQRQNMDELIISSRS